ncbi:Cro/Cl family transcriptional regulator [Vagococcus penaei]|uniref:Cro/Cl family transcriptional regulator n=1 Tax=Vagococcus penaei TaxID=633807 RepID=A0A1Q2D5H7_9ENTE|nr:XRE family transcriptional regulator [Vagococcus penaei]AQP53656.1 Cro/Cl family transcriptional regulator [Vagococcus penaei]RST99235.1 Cro/Cl family transcriptional regulator [Vagococcus penaei]
MLIGKKIKNLRIQKGLTQEELGERTDLSKGYISQLERDLSSPSLETFFSILEVLGVSPKEFFDEKKQVQQVVYQENDYTSYAEPDKGYIINWLVPDSNENEMEPILLHFDAHGEYKEFEPSLSDTFAYVLVGQVSVEIGSDKYYASSGETIYYRALKRHQLKNAHDGISRVLIIATNSYL